MLIKCLLYAFNNCDGGSGGEIGNNPFFSYIKTIAFFLTSLTSFHWPPFLYLLLMNSYLSFKISTWILSSLTHLPRFSQTDLSPSSSVFPRKCVHFAHYDILHVVWYFVAMFYLYWVARSCLHHLCNHIQHKVSLTIWLSLRNVLSSRKHI